MRKISRVRNRFLLVILGFVLLILGVFLIVVSTPVQDRLGDVGQSLPDLKTPISEVVQWDQSWVLPVAFVASILLTLLAIWFMSWQIPKKPFSSLIHISNAEGETIGSLESKVAQRAFEELLNEVPGVKDSDVHFGGHAGARYIQVGLNIYDHVQVPWVVEDAREKLAGLVHSVFGEAPVQIDVQVKISTASQNDSFIDSNV